MRYTLRVAGRFFSLPFVMPAPPLDRPPGSQLDQDLAPVGRPAREQALVERALLHVDGDVWEKPASWQPQLLFIGLGINDFSTPLNPGERWATQDALVADYETAYHGFLDTLRARYGPETFIVVSATVAGEATTFADTVQRVAQDRNAQGDDRVGYWHYDDAGLDRLGCDWHPSTRDHRIISGLLDDYLATVPLIWQPEAEAPLLGCGPARGEREKARSEPAMRPPASGPEPESAAFTYMNVVPHADNLG